MESSDNLAFRHKTFTYHRQYYSEVEISFWWDVGGGSIYYGIIYWPPPPFQQIFKNFFCKWNPVTTKLQNTKHLHITDNTIPWLTFLFNGMCGGGVNILLYNILTPPPPPTNIQEHFFVNGIQWQQASTLKTFTYHRQYYSMVDISFLWEGGSIYYGIINWPPPTLSKMFKNSILKMKSSDNFASRHKKFTYHRQYYSEVDISL